MKTYMTAAVITLMLITSTGAFGYLSREFQHAIAGTNQDTILVQSLEDEQHRLQGRKQEIDAQIAKLPDNVVRGRKALIQQFAPEQEKITTRLGEIDKQLPELKINAIKKNTDVGPIIYVAQAFGTDPEHAVKWVILIIIFVFDPLAISLLLAGNYLIDERDKKKQLLLESGAASALSTVERGVMSQYGFSEEDLIEAKAARLPEPTTYPTMPAVVPPKEEPRFKPYDPTTPESLAAQAEIKAEAAKNAKNTWRPPAKDDSPSVIGPPAPLPTTEELHEALGRQRYVEPLVDSLDHLTHEDLGRQKPDYTLTPELEDFGGHPPDPNARGSAVENLPPARVLPATKPREIITKDQITKPVKSQLEDAAIRDKETDVGLGVKVR